MRAADSPNCWLTTAARVGAGCMVVLGRWLSVVLAAVMLAPSAAGGVEALAHYVDGHEHDLAHHDLAHHDLAHHDLAHHDLAHDGGHAEQLEAPDSHCGVHCHAHHPPVVALAVLPSRASDHLMSPAAAVPRSAPTDRAARSSRAGPERPPRA